ncbi:MAG: zinc-ribbon domain-containing protein [Desulfobacterales bacterium]|nr:zinc-ribbon domain-containing protein [Desulfobacterales bacterium]
MDISCEKCQAKFKIADDKIPQGKAFAVACPKCKTKITVDPAPAAAPKKENTLASEVASEAYDASERPFDFIEEGTKTALICEPDPAFRNRIREVVQGMDYHTTEPKNAREALKQMRFHEFDMVVINEMYDTTDPDQNNLLRFLGRLEMSSRRNMFVALITERFRTGDNMTAFNKSVNTVINTGHMESLDKVLKQGVKEYEIFYKIYKNAQIKTGRT